MVLRDPPAMHMLAAEVADTLHRCTECCAAYLYNMLVVTLRRVELPCCFAVITTYSLPPPPPLSVLHYTTTLQMHPSDCIVTALPHHRFIALPLLTA
jgi:hypothetical protein